MHSPLLTIGLSFLSLAVLTRAYRVDNSNGTIMFGPPNAWTSTVVAANDTTFNVTGIFNATYSAATCRASQGCHAMIPFTGSGITVYSLIYDQVNVSCVVDGGPSHPYVYDASCHVYNGSVPSACYNVSVCDIQSLMSDSHMLVIALMDYNGNNSSFRFDYAVVNETYSPMANSSTMTSMTMDTTSSATMMSSTATMSSAPSSSKSRKKIGAAVGGTIGGLAAVAAIVLAVLYFRKRNQPTPTPSEEFPFAPKTAVLNITPSTSFRQVDTLGTGALPASIHSSNDRSQTHVMPFAPSASATQHSAPSSVVMATETETTVPSLYTSAPVHPLPPIPTLANPTGPGHHAFTDLQISSIQNLLRHNVPGPLVANVMESMMAKDGTADGSTPRARSLSPSETSDLPRYQSKQ